MRVLMEDKLLRATSNKSVDKPSGKGNRYGVLMGSSLMNGWWGLPFLLFLAMGVKRYRHKLFFHAFVRCDDFRTPYHILCILMVAKRW